MQRYIKKQTPVFADLRAPMVGSLTGEETFRQIKNATCQISKNFNALQPRTGEEPISCARKGDGLIVRVPLSAEDTDTEGTLLIRVSLPGCLPNQSIYEVIENITDDRLVGKKEG